jgi:hypothetical protein
MAFGHFMRNRCVADRNLNKGVVFLFGNVEDQKSMDWI